MKKALALFGLIVGLVACDDGATETPGCVPGATQAWTRDYWSRRLRWRRAR